MPTSCSDQGSQGEADLQRAASQLSSADRKQRYEAYDKLLRSGERSRPVLKNLAASQGAAALKARRILFAIDHPIEQLGPTLKSFRSTRESWRTFLWQAELHLDDVCTGQPLSAVREAAGRFGWKPLQPSEQFGCVVYSWSVAREEWGEMVAIPVDFIISVQTQKGGADGEILFKDTKVVLTVHRPHAELLKDPKVLQDDVLSQFLRHAEVVKTAEKFPVVETISFDVGVWAVMIPRGEESGVLFPAGIHCWISMTDRDGTAGSTRHLRALWGPPSWDDWDVAESPESLRKQDRIRNIEGMSASEWAQPRQK